MERPFAVFKDGKVGQVFFVRRKIIMKKKVVALMLGAVMVLSLAACSNSSNNGGDTGADNAGSSQETAAPASDDGSGEAQTGTDTAAASGEVYDTTAFSVTVPDGWAAADYPDSLDLYDGDVDPTQLYVIKDGKSADDILVCPYIMFTYVDDTEYWDLDVSDLYEDYEEIESIEIGGKEYSGYKYTSRLSPQR